MSVDIKSYNFFSMVRRVIRHRCLREIILNQDSISAFFFRLFNGFLLQSFHGQGSNTGRVALANDFIRFVNTFFIDIKIRILRGPRGL